MFFLCFLHSTLKKKKSFTKQQPLLSSQTSKKMNSTQILFGLQNEKTLKIGTQNHPTEGLLTPDSALS